MRFRTAAYLMWWNSIILLLFATAVSAHIISKFARQYPISKSTIRGSLPTSKWISSGLIQNTDTWFLFFADTMPVAFPWYSQTSRIRYQRHEPALFLWKVPKKRFGLQAGRAGPIPSCILHHQSFFLAGVGGGNVSSTVWSGGVLGDLSVVCLLFVLWSALRCVAFSGEVVRRRCAFGRCGRGSIGNVLGAGAAAHSPSQKDNFYVGKWDSLERHQWWAGPTANLKTWQMTFFVQGANQSPHQPIVNQWFDQGHGSRVTAEPPNNAGSGQKIRLGFRVGAPPLRFFDHILPRFYLLWLDIWILFHRTWKQCKAILSSHFSMRRQTFAGHFQGILDLCAS